MKTLEKYIGHDLFIEISCEDGSIVKAETYCRALCEWIDCTEHAKADQRTIDIADLEWLEYEKKRGHEDEMSAGKSLREIMTTILVG